MKITCKEYGVLGVSGGLIYTIEYEEESGSIVIRGEEFGEDEK